MLDAYSITEEKFAIFSGNPVSRIPLIAAAKIPIIIVAGDRDEVVPLEENTRVLERRYRELGAPIEVIIKPGAGHQPHSLTDPTPVADWLVKNARF